MVGTLEGGPMAALFAASHPDRTIALIPYATFARATWAPGLRLRVERGGARPLHGPGVEHRGEGRVVSGVAPSLMKDPEYLGVGGPARAAWRPAQGPSSGSST